MIWHRSVDGRMVRRLLSFLPLLFVFQAWRCLRRLSVIYNLKLGLEAGYRAACSRRFLMVALCVVFCVSSVNIHTKNWSGTFACIMKLSRSSLLCVDNSCGDLKQNFPALRREMFARQKEWAEWCNINWLHCPGGRKRFRDALRLLVLYMHRGQGGLEGWGTLEKQRNRVSRGSIEYFSDTASSSIISTSVIHRVVVTVSIWIACTMLNLRYLMPVVCQILYCRVLFQSPIWTHSRVDQIRHYFKRFSLGTYSSYSLSHQYASLGDALAYLVGD